MLIVLMAASLALTGAIAGFFYAYWCSVMVGLDAASPQVAIAAMQSINAAVRNAMFAPAFFGPLAILPLTAFAAWRAGAARAALFFAAAALVYALGAFLPTVGYNVPLNNALAARSSEAADAAAIWLEYARAWGLGNTARMALSFVMLLLVGLGVFTAGRTLQAPAPASGR